MNKKKIIIFSLVLLIFSAIGYAFKNLSRASGVLLKELGAVVQQVNEKEPGFYDMRAELRKTQREFGIDPLVLTPLRRYAEEIKNNMKNIKFKTRETQDLQITFPIEYIEWLEKKGKQIGDEGSGPDWFWSEAKKVFPGEANWGECKDLFKRALLKALFLRFKDDPQMLAFIKNKLKYVSYDTIKKLFDVNDEEVGNIFREKKRNCFLFNPELEKEVKPIKICSGDVLENDEAKPLATFLLHVFKDNQEMSNFINDLLFIKTEGDWGVVSWQTSYDKINKLSQENKKYIDRIFTKENDCFIVKLELAKPQALESFKPCADKYELDYADVLKNILLLLFKEDKDMHLFLQDLESMSYKTINKLFEEKNDKIGRIFNEKQEEIPSSFFVKGDVLKECNELSWMKDKGDFCKELAQSFNALVGYSVYDLSKNNVIDEEKVPTLFVPYEPKNKFHDLSNIVEKVFRRYIAESIAFKNLFKAISDVLNIKEVKDPMFGDYDIIVFPASSKKTFPKKGDDFTSAFVNSAYNAANLVIYHKEEVLKALLHELNHNIRLDSGIKGFEKGHFAINHKNNKGIHVLETIVESMACITNTIMTAYEMYPKTFFGAAAKMWEREKLFATYQAAKILYLNNFDNLQQFYEPKDNLRVQQTTWAAEYHILKAAVIQNINKLLAIFMDPKYKNKTKRVQALKRLVDEQVRDSVFEKKVNGFIEAFKNGWISNKKTKEWSLGIPNPRNFLFETGRFALIHPKF